MDVDLSLQATYMKRNAPPMLLHRFKVPSGDSLQVYSAGVSDGNGDAPNGLEIEVYNYSSSSQEHSINDTAKEGNPIQSLNVGGDSVGVRIKNNTGRPKDVTGFITMVVA